MLSQWRNTPQVYPLSETTHAHFSLLTGGKNAVNTFRAFVRLDLKQYKYWWSALVGLLLAGVVGYFLHVRSVGKGLVNLSYDLLVTSQGARPVEGIRLIYLDEKSHEALNQSYDKPWDRQLHAQLITKLTAEGARSITFDVVFTGASTDKPQGDQALAEAMKTSGKVIIAADHVAVGPKLKSFFLPYGLFFSNAASIGSAEVEPSADFIVREHTPDDSLPSLSWATAEFLGAPATQSEEIRAAPRWMNYYGPPRVLPYCSYADALATNVLPASYFSNTVVFIGATMMTKFAGERKDEYRNPFSYWERSNFSPGVEIQATACLNLLRGDWLRRWPLTIEMAIILIVGAMLGATIVWLRPSHAIFAAFGGSALVLLLSWLIFKTQLVWFPCLIILVQIAVALVWSVTFNTIQLYVEKRLYEHTLALYLSPKLVKKFSRDPKLLKPGAEEQTLTIFFSDIADFTTISQKMPSAALAKMMNIYFHSAVSECIKKTDGTVVKYIGDAIFAFWNAPEAQDDHALRACEAALRLRDQVVHRPSGEPLHTRMGLHTGPAHVGNFGSMDRVDYTALGESVNLASRLEGLNKMLGTQSLLSRATKDRIGDQLVVRPLGFFQLKGFDTSVEVFELVGWPAEAEQTRPWRESFAQALENFSQKNLELAQLGFRQTLELRPDDGPSKFYLARLEDLQALPSVEGWSTHTVMKEK